MERLGGLTALAVVAWGSAALAAKPTPPPPVPYEAGPEVFAQRLTTAQPQDRVLIQMEIGARSFWKGDYDQSRRALDDAIARIDAVFADGEAAAKARKLWYDEGSKDFKGEPYERAMVYLYRGLIFLHDADYENARAAFRRGLMQDAFAEEDQNRTDFALLLFLDAWASHLNGDEDLRDEVLERMKLLRPDFGGIRSSDDTLVLIETGQGPRKLGDGAQHSFFVYRRGKPILENQAQVLIGAASMQAYPMEDIYWQAVTRGGREIDQVLQGKAKFKAATGGAGSVLADTSVALSSNAYAFENSGKVANAGLALGAISGVLMIVSSSARPEADTRTWSSLPDTVHVLTLGAAGKPQDLTARFLKSGAPVEGGEKAIRCEIDDNRKTLCLVRAH